MSDYDTLEGAQECAIHRGNMILQLQAENARLVAYADHLKGALLAVRVRVENELGSLITLALIDTALKQSESLQLISTPPSLMESTRHTPGDRATSAAAHVAGSNPPVGTIDETLAHYVPPMYGQILWRGRYYNLPISENPASKESDAKPYVGPVWLYYTGEHGNRWCVWSTPHFMGVTDRLELIYQSDETAVISENKEG